jgi:hypothetical protein
LSSSSTGADAVGAVAAAHSYTVDGVSFRVVGEPSLLDEVDSMPQIRPVGRG